ncbi:MAG: sigma-70 family RNA polymerase sigma factor [Clostridiaceae bacterium]|jgi:RNA polymerase sigma-70 factor (ECF subfamily)|nr:sigma-70 family RNA polymerase sigma factor [Clostridiaceae bacterium]
MARKYGESDETILDLYFERSEEALSATVEKYGALLRSLAWNILGNHEDVEECVNDTYVAAWNAIPPQRPEYLKAYLCKIVRNFSLDRVREKTREKRGGGNIPLILDEMQDLLASDDDIAQTVETQELSQMISDYLREQPDRKRIIFLKRYYFASTINEIAEEQKTTEGAVKILLYRMRRELKQVLQDRGYSE